MKKCRYLIEKIEAYGGFDRTYFKCRKFGDWISPNKCERCSDLSI